MNWLIQLRDILGPFGLLGVFAVMVIENIGIPFPTEAGFLVAQGLISTHKTSVPVVIIVITLGHVIGASIAYTIGRYGDVKTANYFAKNPHMHRAKMKLSEWFAKWGSATVFGGRVIGYIRPWSSLAAGFARLDFVPFLIWTTLGSLVFTITSLIFTNYIVTLWLRFPATHIVISIIVLFMFFGIFFVEFGRRTYVRHRRKRD